MIASGFTNAPVTKYLIIGVVLSALLASITDTKYFFWIEVRPHLLDYGQFWRLLTWQLCYTNSTEVLFAAMTLYQLRVVERLWGSQKFASFIISTFLYTALLPPVLLTVVVRPLTAGYINYLPAGFTTLIFALLAQYHAAVPYIYKYRLSSSVPQPGSPTASREYGMNLTSKSTSYLIPLQLALSQLPGSAIAAGVGWIIGFAYRREILPGAARWRVPGWLLGEGQQKERYDSLRRRMEGEAGRATGVEAPQDETRRRGIMGGVIDQFRGGR
ncbi:DSC E3 ubiquitin ligase complex subunit 2-like [Teratosphaeria destructans]|uniref:DSC E3 ubiquitin ligase complex subunit 2-like n=1 Tax=Teratosphaeria destructans TaxID=418781 RepID=A0A9W7SXP2_9PEZI|nr:DSC E3 ubiquitin ligase complex subunit 2-like [Teratosphaeria destructans]